MHLTTVDCINRSCADGYNRGGMSAATRSIKKEFQRCVEQMQAGGAIAADAARRLIALEPAFAAPYLVLAVSQTEEGNLEDAETLLWQGMALQPGSFFFAHQLAHVIEQRRPSSKIPTALKQLALWNLTFGETVPEAVAEMFEGQGQASMDYSDPETFEMLATVNEVKDKEIFDDPEVYERLLPFKLLVDLKRQAPSIVASSLLRDILEHAARCEPLFRGALREWGQNQESLDERTVQLLIALIGEISGPDVLNDLLDPDLMTATYFLHTNWALWRLGQRHPSQVFATLRGIIPQASAALRCAIGEHIGFLPDGPENTAALLELLNGFPRIARQEDAPHLLLLVAYFLEQRGEQEKAQAEIRRHSSVLPKSGRRWLQEKSESPQGFLPLIVETGITEFDIEQLCIERVLMDEEEDEDEDNPYDGPDEGAEEDEWIEPVRALVRPSRNDPCWCGSGKKYKKCHLESDEAEQWSGPATSSKAGEVSGSPRRLIGELLDFIGKSRSDLERALHLYFDKSPAQLKEAELESGDFAQWMIYDYRSPATGRTPIEEYLHRKGGSLNERDRAALESWRDARYGLYEVERVEEGRGIHLRNLFTDETPFVHDVSSSNELVRGDCLLSRVELFEGRHEFSGNGTIVPRGQVATLIDRIKTEAKAAAQAPAEFVRANSHRLHRVVKEISDDWLSNVEIRNAEGDLVELCSAAYEIINEPELLRTLRGLEELEEIHNEPGGRGTIRFAWLETVVKERRRSYGSIEIQDGQLKLECNSRNRLELGRDILEAKAVGSLQHLADAFESMDTVKKRVADRPPTKKPSSVPPEVEREVVLEFLEQHYAKWPDQKLPALGGKTPRQAVKTAAGRQAVEQLIRDMEHGAERDRKQGRPAFDFKPVRKALGL